MTESNYLGHVSGLKGMGALLVLIDHFIYCFNPLFIPRGMQSIPIKHIPGANLLVNGNFAVCLFILLSGYLAARNAERYKDLDDYGSAIIRRYLRLMIPLAVAAVLSYLLCVLGLYRIQVVSGLLGNELTGNYFRSMHFRHLLISVLWAPLGYHNLVTPFWMMKYILLGSFLVLGMTLAIRRQRPTIQLLSIIFVMVIALYWDRYYACALGGMLLFKLGQLPMSIPNALRLPTVLLMISVALWLAAEQDCMTFIDKYKNPLASFLFVFAVFLSKPLTTFFGSKPMDELGKLSLGVFIFHWQVICSLSCWLYLEWPIQNNYFLLGLIFIVTLAVTLFLAHLYNRWVAPWAATLQRRIIELLNR